MFSNSSTIFKAYWMSVHLNIYDFHTVMFEFRGYSASNLMDDLKLIYRIAGQEGKGVTFIFTDNEIKEEGFLEYLNNLLSSGEVANLFAKDEIDDITQSLIGVMKKEQPRRPPTGENLYDFFISRARNNLHVVLCFSPVSHVYQTIYLLSSFRLHSKPFSNLLKSQVLETKNTRLLKNLPVGLCFSPVSQCLSDN
jgi:hypothetical protein